MIPSHSVLLLCSSVGAVHRVRSPMERDMLTQAGLGERIGNIIEYKLI